MERRPNLHRQGRNFDRNLPICSYRISKWVYRNVIGVGDSKFYTGENYSLFTNGVRDL